MLTFIVAILIASAEFYPIVFNEITPVATTKESVWTFTDADPIKICNFGDHSYAGEIQKDRFIQGVLGFKMNDSMSVQGVDTAISITTKSVLTSTSRIMVLFNMTCLGAPSNQTFLVTVTESGVNLYSGSVILRNYNSAFTTANAMKMFSSVAEIMLIIICLL